MQTFGASAENASLESATPGQVLDWCLRLIAKLCLAGALFAVAGMDPAGAVTYRTIVSLTFDDGLTQSAARDILHNHGMHGTFYINSAFIGSGGTYLTKPEVDALYADGNEIAAHTTTHADLATLSDAAQQEVICADLANLLNWGYPVHSLAYPYSSTGPTTQGIVAAGCPGVGNFESARAVGGIVSGAECSGCPFAESLTPANPYYIVSPPSVKSTTTLQELQTYVTQAETTGGGWVPLVFHRVCDGCSDLAVSPAVLDAFLTWLQQRESRSTYVRTVHQVMAGDLPPPPPPPELAANQLLNPSLEDDGDHDDQPDCWDRSNYGTNSGTWTRTGDARTGSFGETLHVSAIASGDRKLLPYQDAGQPGGCAPTVEEGALYELSAWYKSDTAAVVELFYQDAGGVWRYWRDGPELPASAAWSQMVHIPGLPPTGTRAVSFGVALKSVGTLTTDDYSMAKILDNPPPPDATPPIVSSFTPASGTVVSGPAVSLSALVVDDIAVKQVDFLVNGAIVASDTLAPYAATWDTTATANGSVDYSIRALDTSDNETVSAVRQLTVHNVPPDFTPPSVVLTQPGTGGNPPGTGGGAPAPVSGFIVLAADASDDVGVDRVEFLANGTVVGTVAAAPYSINWDTASVPNGQATLIARAYDAANNSSDSQAATLAVSNSTAPNLLSNRSLEVDANNNQVPDCWMLGGYGTNTFAWSRVAGAHSGGFAESLEVTSLASGDRKLVQTQDSGACAPAVTAGAHYTLSAWYKSTIPTVFVLYYRTSAGVWQYWRSSPAIPAANDWALATYATPAIPAGATHLTFGLSLGAVGTLVTDDYALTLAP